MRQITTASLVVAIALTCAAGLARAERVVDYVEAKSTTNPAPAVALDTFAKFEIAPIGMDAPYAGQDANESARERLQDNLDERVTPLLAQWNDASGGKGTLKITPTVRHVKFITGGKRFFAGGLAGGSAVLMTVTLTDASSGKVVATPEFYSHANAMGATWSFGATDKTMLIRTTQLIADYLKANYSTAVGGPTGKE